MSLYVLFIVEIERYLKGSSKLIREVLLKHETDDEEFLPKNVSRGEVLKDSQLLDLLDINKTSLRVTIAELFNSYMRSMVGTICTFVNLCSDRREALRVTTREINFEQNLIETLTQKSRQLSEERLKDNKIQTLQLQSEIVRMEETIEEMQQTINQLCDKQPQQLQQTPVIPVVAEPDNVSEQFVFSKKFILAFHVDGIYQLSSINSVCTHIPWIIHCLYLIVENVISKTEIKEPTLRSTRYSQCSRVVILGSTKTLESVLSGVSDALESHPWPEELTSLPEFSKGPRLRAGIHYATVNSKEIARTISLIPVAPVGKFYCTQSAASVLSSTASLRKTISVTSHPIDASYFGSNQRTGSCVYQLQLKQSDRNKNNLSTKKKLKRLTPDLNLKSYCDSWVVDHCAAMGGADVVSPPIGVGSLMCISVQKCYQSLELAREGCSQFSGIELRDGVGAVKSDGSFTLYFIFHSPIHAIAAALQFFNLRDKEAPSSQISPSIGIFTETLTYESYRNQTSGDACLTVSQELLKQALLISQLSISDQIIICESTYKAASAADVFADVHPGVELYFKVFSEESARSDFGRGELLFAASTKRIPARGGKEKSWSAAALPPASVDSRPKAAVESCYLVKIRPYGIEHMDSIAPTIAKEASSIFRMLTTKHICEYRAAVVHDWSEHEIFVSFESIYEALQCIYSLNHRLMTLPWTNTILQFPDASVTTGLFRGLAPSCGIVVFGKQSASQTLGYRVSNESIQKCSKLCSDAKKGGILITEEVFDATFNIDSSEVTELMERFKWQDEGVFSPINDLEGPAVYSVFQQSLIGRLKIKKEVLQILKSVDEEEVRPLSSNVNLAIFFAYSTSVKTLSPFSDHTQQTSLQQELQNLEVVLNSSRRSTKGLSELVLSEEVFIEDKGSQVPNPYTVGNTVFENAAVGGLRIRDAATEQVRKQLLAPFYNQAEAMNRWISSVVVPKEEKLLEKETKETARIANLPFSLNDYRKARLAFELSLGPEPGMTKKANCLTILCFLLALKVKPSIPLLRSFDQTISFLDLTRLLLSCSIEDFDWIRNKVGGVMKWGYMTIDGSPIKGTTKKKRHNYRGITSVSPPKTISSNVPERRRENDKDLGGSSSGLQTKPQSKESPRSTTSHKHQQDCLVTEASEARKAYYLGLQQQRLAEEANLRSQIVSAEAAQTSEHARLARIAQDENVRKEMSEKMALRQEKLKRKREEDRIAAERERRAAARRELAEQQKKIQVTMSQCHRAMRVAMELLIKFLSGDDKKMSPDLLTCLWADQLEVLSSETTSISTIDTPYTVSYRNVTQQERDSALVSVSTHKQFSTLSYATDTTQKPLTCSAINMSVVGSLCSFIEQVRDIRSRTAVQTDRNSNKKRFATIATTTAGLVTCRSREVQTTRLPESKILTSGELSLKLEQIAKDESNYRTTLKDLFLSELALVAEMASKSTTSSAISWNENYSPVTSQERTIATLIDAETQCSDRKTRHASTMSQPYGHLAELPGKHKSPHAAALLQADVEISNLRSALAHSESIAVTLNGKIQAMQECEQVNQNPFVGLLSPTEHRRSTRGLPGTGGIGGLSLSRCRGSSRMSATLRTYLPSAAEVTSASTQTVPVVDPRCSMKNRVSSDLEKFDICEDEGGDRIEITVPTQSDDLVQYIGKPTAIQCSPPGNRKDIPLWVCQQVQRLAKEQYSELETPHLHGVVSGCSFLGDASLEFPSQQTQSKKSRISRLSSRDVVISRAGEMRKAMDLRYREALHSPSCSPYRNTETSVHPYKLSKSVLRARDLRKCAGPNLDADQNVDPWEG